MFIELHKIVFNFFLCFSYWLGALLEHEERINDIVPDINTLLSCCNEIKSSKKFKLIMGTILAVGNYMNGGTKRGRADGFKLNALLKLESTKLIKINDDDDKIEETAIGMKNMFDLIVHQSWKNDNNIKDIVNELSTLKKSSKVDIFDLKSKVNKLSSDLARLDGNYKRVVETTKNINVRKTRLCVILSLHC